jgi:hypothetical protein
MKHSNITQSVTHILPFSITGQTKMKLFHMAAGMAAIHCLERNVLLCELVRQ